MSKKGKRPPSTTKGSYSSYRLVDLTHIITHEAKKITHYVTSCSAPTAHSQQIVTKAVQYLQNILTLHVDKVYTTFWRHIAQRDRYTAAVPERSPYDIGYDHALVQLSYASKVPQHVDDEQDTYFQALSYEQSLEYDRGSLHGFTGRSRGGGMSMNTLFLSFSPGERLPAFDAIYHPDGTCTFWDCRKTGVVLAYDDFSPEFAHWFCRGHWEQEESEDVTFWQIAEDRRTQNSERDA